MGTVLEVVRFRLPPESSSDGENLLLYTNANCGREIAVETVAWRLLPITRSSIQPTVLVFEMQKLRSKRLEYSCLAAPSLTAEADLISLFRLWLNRVHLRKRRAFTPLEWAFAAFIGLYSQL